jgi:hypothetical protein
MKAGGFDSIAASPKADEATGIDDARYAETRSANNPDWNR